MRTTKTAELVNCALTMPSTKHLNNRSSKKNKNEKTRDVSANVKNDSCHVTKEARPTGIPNFLNHTIEMRPYDQENFRSKYAVTVNVESHDLVSKCQK
jgi:hypothetical protein